MYKSIEEMKKECYEIGRKEVKKEVTHALLEEGSLTLEKIAEITKLPLDEIQTLQSPHHP